MNKDKSEFTWCLFKFNGSWPKLHTHLETVIKELLVELLLSDFGKIVLHPSKQYFYLGSTCDQPTVIRSFNATVCKRIEKIDPTFEIKSISTHHITQAQLDKSLAASSLKKNPTAEQNGTKFSDKYNNYVQIYRGPLQTNGKIIKKINRNLYLVSARLFCDFYPIIYKNSEMMQDNETNDIRN